MLVAGCDDGMPTTHPACQPDDAMMSMEPFSVLSSFVSSPPCLNASLSQSRLIVAKQPHCLLIIIINAQVQSSVCVCARQAAVEGRRSMAAGRDRDILGKLQARCHRTRPQTIVITGASR